MGKLCSLFAARAAKGKFTTAPEAHSVHISKETMAYLGTRPGRFEYVHTPKHGSWLNLIECAFSKMARTFLRHIRVQHVTLPLKDVLKHWRVRNEQEQNVAILLGMRTRVRFRVRQSSSANRSSQSLGVVSCH